MVKDQQNIAADEDEDEFEGLDIGPDEDADVDEDDLEGGFLDVNLNDVPTFHVAKAGEHPLRCYKAEIRISKGEKTAGQKMAILSLEHAEDPTVKEMTYVIMLPFRGMEERPRLKRLAQLKEACDAFGVDYTNGVRIKEFEGQEAWAVLTVENSDEYGEQNRIVSFVTGPGTGSSSSHDEDDDY